VREKNANQAAVLIDVPSQNLEGIVVARLQEAYDGVGELDLIACPGGHEARVKTA
jgi:pantoate kinase